METKEGEDALVVKVVPWAGIRVKCVHCSCELDVQIADLFARRVIGSIMDGPTYTFHTTCTSCTREISVERREIPPYCVGDVIVGYDDHGVACTERISIREDLLVARQNLRISLIVTFVLVLIFGAAAYMR